MPREGMNNSEDSNTLRRLTGTLSPRFTAGYELSRSNLWPPCRAKMKAPDLAATGSSAALSIGIEKHAQPTRDGRATQ
jgi:hypothetical protein